MAIKKRVFYKSLIFMLPWPMLAFVLLFTVVLHDPLVIFYFFSSIPALLTHKVIAEEVGVVIFLAIWLSILMIPQIEFKREKRVGKSTYVICSLYSLLNVVVTLYLLLL